jgi:clan AA aspartic protease (TIGR02281 family)
VKKIILCILFILCAYLLEACADMIYLKNGRSVEGVIISEDSERVELQVSMGSVTFERSDIEKIVRASEFEHATLREEWNDNQEQVEQRFKTQEAEEEGKPRTVEFEHGGQSIKLSATLNGNVDASLVLDTGATFMVLRKSMAEKLGVNLEKASPDIRLTVADGRQISATRVVLKSVKVQNVEANNIDAAIMLDEIGDVGFGDGLLGMSFLKNFNFKVDYREKKLTLEKL